MYDTALVPTDGRDGSEAAVEHAVDVATTDDPSAPVLTVDIGDG